MYFSGFQNYPDYGINYKLFTTGFLGCSDFVGYLFYISLNSSAFSFFVDTYIISSSYSFICESTSISIDFSIFVSEIKISGIGDSIFGVIGSFEAGDSSSYF